ncbi:hypothetical protein RchiOBHm_Chr6g0304601 [Rosa chinensis]|uniref:Uncharacterized protein n=1 Tax=Rosa chinensis TaxID=74649 RepID=A0A2P6PZK4_ROSCH|nr:hypothetical protein RchiOBHm_Chr6g0304601 [Rosa chinensis]
MHVRNYLRDVLIQAGFHESKLQHLKTMEEIDDALSKGSANGGVAVVVDETPSMKLFLAKYCNKYAMSTRPLFKTDGLAFVRPSLF